MTQWARYTEQMPFVGTPEQKRQIEEEAERLSQRYERKVSRAEVIRLAIDRYFASADVMSGEGP